MYPRHCRNKPKSFFCRPAFGFIVFGLLTFVVFAAGLYHLRNDEWKNGGEEVAENLGTVGAVITASVPDEISRETKIKSLASGEEIGAATQGIDKGVFYHTVKISLPAIDREKEFYEGWLLCQTPFDFFSTGEMVTDVEGNFVLEWAGNHDDIDDYTHVVITREARGSGAAPGEKVAEGEWK